MIAIYVVDDTGRRVQAIRPIDDATMGNADRCFGGEVWRTVGAWDHVHAPLRYHLGSRLLPRLRQRIAGS